MAWVRLDDQFADHPKILRVGPTAGWLHVCALCYCGRYLTDGFVPTGQVRKLADLDNIDALVIKLVDAGMWELAEDGYHIHDYLVYNPSREKVLEERRQKAERQERWRKSKEEQDALQDALQDEPLTPAPSPSPSPYLSIALDRESSIIGAGAPSSPSTNPPTKQPSQKPPPKPPPYNDDQLRFLGMFDAKRFANHTQAGAVVALLNAYPTQFWEAADWAADNGWPIGKSIRNMKSALPKWGKPKPGGNHSGNRQRRVEPGTEQPTLEQVNRIRAQHGKGPLTADEFATGQ